MRRITATVLVVVALLAVAPPAEAGAGPERREPASWAPQDWARRLLYDLQNRADPSGNEITRLEFALTYDLDEPYGTDIERFQRELRSRWAVVDDLFAAVLRRDADVASRDLFVARLDRIGRQRVMADLLASPEYRTRQGGGTDGGWVDAMYRDALGRPADPAGRQYFLDQLAAGRTRESIAAFLTGGAEGRTALVRRLLVELLRRPADAPSVRYYADRLAAGASVERVIALVTSSVEYMDKAMTPRFPTSGTDLVLLDRHNRLEYLRPSESYEIEVVDVTGLAEGDDLLAIDVRPATGGLYGVTETGQVVAVDAAGLATPVGAPLPGLDPEGMGLAVDPAADAVVVTSGATMQWVDPDTGVAGPAVTAAYAAGDLNAGTVPQLAAVAFTTDAAPYAIDVAADALVIPAADGTLTTVGPLHADANPRAALDIDPAAPHRVFAVLTVPREKRSMWRIDLASGEPRLHSSLSEDVIGLAVLPV